MSKLTLEPEEFGMAYQAIVLGERRPQLAEWKDYISLIDKLQKQGSKEKTDVAELYKAEKPVTIDIERAESALLASCVESTSWRPLALKGAYKLLQKVKGLTEI